MCVQYRGGAQYCGGYLEYRGGVQYRGGYDKCGGYLEYRGGYHEYCGGILSTVEDIMMHVGGYHEYRGVFSTVGDTIL